MKNTADGEYKRILVEDMQNSREKLLIRKKRLKNYDMHWHDCFEILYVLSGQAEYFAEDQKCEIRPGDFILIRCGEIHTVVCPEGGDADILVVKFMPLALSQAVRFPVHIGFFEQ